MISASERSAWKAVERAVDERKPRSALRSPADRRLLVVLPYPEEEQRTAWTFLRDMAIPVSQMTLVVEGETVFYSPDAAAGRIIRLEKGDLDRKGLPSSKVLTEIRALDHDVTLLLTSNVTPATVLLCGASSALNRIAFYKKELEDYFDLLIEQAGDYTMSIQVLHDVFMRLEPPVIPMRKS